MDLLAFGTDFLALPAEREWPVGNFPLAEKLPERVGVDGGNDLPLPGEKLPKRVGVDGGSFLCEEWGEAAGRCAP